MAGGLARTLDEKQGSNWYAGRGRQAYQQMFAKPAARGFKAPHLLHGQLHATRKPIRLHLSHHNNQFVVLEPLFVGVDQGLVGTCFDDPGLVIKLEQRQFATLPMDDPQVADDAGQ